MYLALVARAHALLGLDGAGTALGLVGVGVRARARAGASVRLGFRLGSANRKPRLILALTCSLLPAAA